MTEIGKPKRRWEAEPLHEPVPGPGPQEPAYTPDPAPVAPVRVAEPVPAGV